jgi:Na+/proline symporter
MEFIQTYLGLPLAMVLICVFIIPLYRENPIITAYQYLETRFGPATRTLASLIFMVSRCLAFGVTIYAPAVVLSAMTGFNLVVTVLFIGLLTTGYTIFGGVRAVVWTDVKQMSVIMGGLILSVGILLYELLPHFDFLEILRLLGASGRLNAIEAVPASTNLIPNLKALAGEPSFWDDRYNLWSGVLGGLFLMLAYFGCDQSQVQRILTVPSADESRKTLLMSAFAKIPMQFLVLFIGALLFLFNVVGDPPLLFNPNDRLAAEESTDQSGIQELDQQYRQALVERRVAAFRHAESQNPVDQNELLHHYQAAVQKVARLRADALKEVGSTGDTNYVFPHFILNEVPPIFLGLMIAAIFAAAMSSADSVLNSLSAASIVDIYRRWIRPAATERQAVRTSRLLTGFWGLAATYAALQFEGRGSVIELINQVGSYFYGSLLGVFVLALVCRRAGPRAGFWGLLGGMATVILVDQTLQFQFLWYNIIGCLGVLAVGWTVSLFEKS